MEQVYYLGGRVGVQSLLDAIAVPLLAMHVKGAKKGNLPTRSSFAF